MRFPGARRVLRQPLSRGFPAIDGSRALSYTKCIESVVIARERILVFFRQVLHRDLGCASYVLGDAGEAVVVDPRWDIDVYLEIAAEQRLEITHVIDTHDHADHVSGRLRLVQATGAQAHRAGTADDRAPDLIRAGEQISVGSVQVRALAAPGHRPEHLTFA